MTSDGLTAMPRVLLAYADQAEWQDERSYDYTARLTLRGWAWEFLRRNPAFQRDLSAVRQQANALSRGAFLDVIASAGDLSQWGVLFRRVL
ncbi:transcriptional regulator domain-containing protein [Mesorhizobium neociceri]|uniref:transcriptional regulator domain-containing protein n=1 Tax=Mesorhizobium neociceri TaxID=1307853 RepID=UPI0038B2EAC8